MNNVKVSIIIPTLNHLNDCLKPCIESIQENVDLSDKEVIIVANGCTDGTKAYLDTLPPPFRYLWYERPTGFAQPNNDGVREAKGEYVMLMNNDCFIRKPGAPEMFIKELEDNPDVGIVGNELSYNEYADRNYLKFYCVMMKRSLYNEFGGLDEAFRDGTCEDVDLCIKVENAGYRLSVVTVPVFHRLGTTVREIPNLSQVLTRNTFLLGRRYNSKWYQEIQKQMVEKTRVSIVIPTYNHLEDCLKPCIESILKYVDLRNKEIIVVANGCKDGTRDYVESLGGAVRLLWFDEPLGATRAYNEGMKAAKYPNILVLNNDVVFLEQPVDQLINMHLVHFNDPTVGIVGPIMHVNSELGREFIVFFCAMIRKEVIDRIGYLDETFNANVGSSEDIDFCIRAQDAGWNIAVAGEMRGSEPGQVVGSVPIFHKGEVTVGDESLVKDWKGKFEANLEVLKRKYIKKVSIVIGTYNHLEDCLKPCIESIKKYVDLRDKEVIIVANGCVDGTKEYVESLGPPFRLLWFDKPLGFPLAYNHGIKVSHGDYVLLLNNDTVLLEQEKDQLINMHLAKFEEDPKVGIAGPLMNFSPGVDRNFIVFFCAMIKRDVFTKIGGLDVSFREGAGEDTDFCIRAESEGFKLAVVGEHTGITADGTTNSGSVPIYHKGEATAHDNPDHDKIIERNTRILIEKYRGRATNVLCTIPTKNRYFTTLPLAIQSVLTQDVKPDKLIIYDDGDHADLRQNPTYQYLFNALLMAGIKWEVTWTPGVGQHHAHQLANTNDYKYVWRLDDDNVAQPDVLEKLLSHMKDGVGAVGGSVVTPGQEAKSDRYALHLLDIMALPNIQWARGKELFEVNHLYSSFLYRSNTVDYCLELSKVAHREETIFSHRLAQAGYRLLVDRSALTYHFRNPEGGIRTERDPALWEADEVIFRKQLEKWGYKFIALSHGLGDHLMFVNVIPELLKRWKVLVLCCVYGEVFAGLPNVVVKPLQEAGAWGAKETGIYEWMIKYNWKRSMVEAYEKLYLD